MFYCKALAGNETLTHICVQTDRIYTHNHIPSTHMHTRYVQVIDRLHLRSFGIVYHIDGSCSTFVCFFLSFDGFSSFVAFFKSWSSALDLNVSTELLFWHPVSSTSTMVDTIPFLWSIKPKAMRISIYDF